MILRHYGEINSMRMAFVDLETTGGVATRDRIIEVAIVVTEDGQEVERWSSLVDPEQPLSPFIVRYTGISDQMLRDAPLFATVADKVAELTDDALFVAHNSRFDYGFLKNEFRRLKRPWQATALCTVKLSRALYPQHNKHNLDIIIQRHQLPQVTRHRAMGDVDAMLAFYRHAQSELGCDKVAQQVAILTQRPSLPPGLAPDLFDQLPAAPGVYRFFDDDGALIYVGKSVNLYQRVSSHFSGHHSTSKGHQMTDRVRHIEWTQTAGELTALLQELHEIKQHRPFFNGQLKPVKKVVSLQLQSDERGYHRIVFTEQIDPLCLADYFGTFRSKNQANKALTGLATSHRLCLRLLQLEAGDGACFGYQLGECQGPCCGQESAELWNLRLGLALNSMKLTQWPWQQPMVLIEEDSFSDLRSFHLIDHWVLLQSCDSAEALQPTDLQACLDAGSTEFELDRYKLLSSYLLGGGKRLTVQPLDEFVRSRDG
ncbi:DNA polymerase III subunit epsilon [Corallincola spongiicola]|uniref:Excinuclease cho n=2 Tax=Corallincola spongiicola TaxID=2520508 RepID=A0ABY1WQC3_9GAMM|nr:DNA polymerase III subunit epsilon [Corallincola spongiicola]